MGRTNTVIWEDIKSEHTTCLCYSESKGLYASSIYFAPEEEILFLPHGYKGFWEKEVQIPKDNLSIKIKTNFEYGSMTYMKAIVERDGKRLLDFDKSKFFVLNNSSVMTLDVEHYAWKNYSRKLSLYQKDLIPLSVYHLPYRTLRKSTIFYLKGDFYQKFIH